MIPEVSVLELIEKLGSDSFFRDYGNPVKCRIMNRDRILFSAELHERLFGKADLEEENTIEIDDFIRLLILQRLDENPIQVDETEEGYSITVEQEVYDAINRILLEEFNVSFEEMFTKFIYWMVENPEDFEVWIKEAMKERRTESDY